MHNLSLSDEESLASSDNEVMVDTHLEALNNKDKQMKIMHINTQSMISTFDGLLMTLRQYPFDFISMSETWLKNNPVLLQHVNIPGYCNAFRNRDEIKGGEVGVYVKETIKFKRRTDIENRYPKIEHLWIELPGRNKNSKMLLGTIYRSQSQMHFSEWLETLEDLLSELVCSWDGMLLLAGDVNIDILKQNNLDVKRYTEVLDSLNLEQVITKATRATKSSKTLIDHIVTNLRQRITYSNVLLCPLVSDHDAPYITVNVRVPRYEPRYKFIRNEKQFDETSYVDDFAALQFEIVFAFEDPDDQIRALNTVILECLDRHAPLRRTKLTRPPAPWLHDPDIISLQKKCKIERREAQKRPSKEGAWNILRETRNKLKKVIRKAKRTFMLKALPSKDLRKFGRQYIAY